MREKIIYVGKVTVVHIITYLLCGMVFSTLLDYHSLFEMDVARDFMRPFNSISTLIGPLIQILRGIIFGLALLLFRDSLKGNLGWLKLWGIMVLIGIINTPAPAPFSIEGVIYTRLPLAFHFRGAPEILIQTFLFSYFVARPKPKKKANSFLHRNKIPLTVTAIAAFGFSLSGIILAMILGVDIMFSASDPYAIIIMLVSMAIIYMFTRWYCRNDSTLKDVIIIGIYYLSIAVFPTLYNILSGSTLSSWIPLLTNMLLVLLLWVILKQMLKRERENSTDPLIDVSKPE